MLSPSGPHNGLVRVLVVEDELKLAGVRARGLQEEGYATDVAAANRAEGGADVWITLPMVPTAAAVERAAALT